MLLTAYSESSYIEGAKESGVSGYLVKPVDEKALVPCIELAMARSSEMKALKTDVEKANERLETRKVVEKAKGYLMETNPVSEAEAYEYIRKMSNETDCRDPSDEVREVVRYDDNSGTV